MTKDEFMFTPMAKAFANDGDREESLELDSELKMNLTTGFPPVYSQPLASGGRLIQRKELNLLFYQMTLFQNFIQNGGCITWDSKVMSAIGGYPSGAILSIVDAESGIETRVQSMIDNNYLKPTSDTIGVKYKVNTSSTPNTYTKDDSGDVLWRYVHPLSGSSPLNLTAHDITLTDGVFIAPQEGTLLGSFSYVGGHYRATTYHYIDIAKPNGAWIETYRFVHSDVWENMPSQFSFALNLKMDKGTKIRYRFGDSVVPPTVTLNFYY